MLPRLLSTVNGFMVDMEFRASHQRPRASLPAKTLQCLGPADAGAVTIVTANVCSVAMSLSLIHISEPTRPEPI
eukprot:5061912-Pyramimonas_sp.AAC.2